MVANHLIIKARDGTRSSVPIPEGKRVIIRYPNRRLYDTHTSEYATLANIISLVRDRVPIFIVCKTTGKDLTRDTLLNALREIDMERVEGPGGLDPLLPQESIARLIQAS